MTLQNVPGGISWPTAPLGVAGPPSIASITFDTNDDKFALVFQSPVTDTITDFGFSTGTVTTGGNIDMRVETVSSGLPSGSLVGANTNIVKTVNNADDNVHLTGTLTSAASVTKGTYYALVLASGSTMNMAIALFGDILGTGDPVPYSAANGAAYNAPSANPPFFSVKFGTAGYLPVKGFYPMQNVSNTMTTFNNTSTPDVVGNKITPSFTCKVNGAWAWIDLDGDGALNLYDTDGVTVIATGSLSSVIPNSTNGFMNYVLFDNEVTLTAGQSYWLAVEPTSATNLTVYYYDFTSSSIREQIQGGVNMVYSSAKDPSGTGSWTDTTTRLCTLGLMISALDDGAGGGSGGSFTFGS